jgi:histidinol-phosphate aminotransferase
VGARQSILRLEPVVHGGAQEGELTSLHLDLHQILDFSVSVNPYGPSPQVWEAIRAVLLSRYPDPQALDLCRSIGEELQLDPSWILPGNGSVELIRAIAFACLRPWDRVLIVEPTFGEYERAALLMGARVEGWRSHPEENFTLNLQGLTRRLQTLRPRLTFLCNPNNPTGHLLGLKDLEAILEACTHLLVVDEAFINFADPSSTALPLLPSRRVLILRSLTKDYALAGLRLGYLIAPPDTVEMLRKILPPWSVNALAQAAGCAAIHDRKHLWETLALTRQAAISLREGVQTLEIPVIPSQTHFFLAEVGDAVTIRQRLLIDRLVVRDCTSFGLPQFIRIATRQPHENDQLLKGLKRIWWSG